MFSLRTSAAALAIATIAVLTTAVPASAHDQLVESTPSANERLETAPESVTLAFSGELLQLDDAATGTTVLVVDSTGRDWVSGGVSVELDTVTVQVAEGMPDAGYQVRWQVVSADGHPIAGVIPFTVGDAEPMAVAQPDAPASDVVAGTDTNQVTAESNAVLRIALVGVGGAAIAGIAFALIQYFRRRQVAPVEASTTEPTEQL